MGVAQACRSSPRTEALRRALAKLRSDQAVDDLLFLESWEANPLPGAGAALRVGQLRRANPRLAAEIRAELRRGCPLTSTEREALEAVSAGSG
jgi:hypothetical protein